jgi:hypothetical protein
MAVVGNLCRYTPANPVPGWQSPAAAAAQDVTVHVLAPAKELAAQPLAGAARLICMALASFLFLP